MPYYEYHCGTNGRTLEVRHGMNERLATWGEVAGRSGVDMGDTPEDTPVERLMSVPAPVTGSSRDTGFQGCGGGCACVPSN
ncbi:MAG: zinc ribbon domain-containing protein [Gemmatimonadetes bacterium]|nr:zinc ribbon domain-containing protein [Gemmatimonadota bacterium]MDA1102361.1 zinc ribbon domain-containing protein [Gemmatimonadota bacterium]